MTDTTKAAKENPVRHTFRVRSIFLSSLRDDPNFLPEQRRDTIRRIVEGFQKEGIKVAPEDVEAGLIERLTPSAEVEGCEELNYSYTWRGSK